MAHTGVVIHMRNVPGEPKLRALDFPLVYQKMNGKNGLIPADFTWDGSSVPWLGQLFFPRLRHPISSCRHDYRCLNARGPIERAWADREFRKDVGTTSWWITALVGYIGVRIGAYLGIGCRY